MIATESDKRLMRAVRNILRITRILQQVCEENGFTLAQYRAISWICRTSMARPYTLAEQAAVSRPAVAAMVNGLVKRKLIKRVSVAKDGRGVYLTPLPKTTKVLEELEWEMIVRLREVFGEAAEIISMLAVSSTLEEALDANLQDEIQKIGEPLK